jgi:hypothetical protein
MNVQLKALIPQPGGTDDSYLSVTQLRYTETTMIRIRVEYDKYNRTFRLVDRALAPVLDDGETYELALPLGLQETGESGVHFACALKSDERREFLQKSAAK